MLYFTLNNELKIPAVGFGTYKAAPDESTSVIQMAIEAGYRYFDTATVYGTEKYLGSALEHSGLKREAFMIASKLWKPDMMTPQKALEAFNKTLEALRTDYLDVYFIHWPRPELSLTDWKGLDLEIWSLLEDLHAQGRIKTLGLSNFLPYHATHIITNCKILPSISQLEFHPGHTQTFALNYYRERKILVQAWSPVARGRVFNDELIRELSEKYHASPALICLCFCVQEGVMPLPKASTLERMKENLECLTLRLDPEDISRIENMPPLGWSGEHPDRERIRV